MKSKGPMDREHEHMEVRDRQGAPSPDEIRAFYDELPPEERRERIFLAPAYRTLYNRIVQPDEMVGFPGSAYFWQKWLPVLKPTAAAVYIVLRDIAYANKNLPEDAWCYPDQAELARMLGLSDRKTIRQHLNTLESYGFLKREKDYRAIQDQEHGGKLARQKTSLYHIYYEIPLVAEDAVTLLISGEGFANSLNFNTVTNEGGNPPHRYGGKPSTPVNHLEGNPPRGASYPQESTGEGGLSGGISSSYNVRGSNVHSTLDNVSERTPSSNVSRKRQSRFQQDPRIASMTALEKAKKEEIVLEIARRLNACAGDHGKEEHKSAGLHRWIAYLMPVQLVNDALMAVQDLAYEAQAGRKEMRDPGAYFVGIIRNMAEKEGIDLGPVTRS